MLRSLYITAVYFAFLGVGLAVPFVLSLGYVWVSIFRPQTVAWSILSSLPVSMIMGVLAVGWFIVRDMRAPPRVNAIMAMSLAMAVWVTFTTAVVAVVPDSAWGKWDWAFKTIVFSAFMVFVFRSRLQIEALLQVMVFSFAAHFIPVGLKTLVTGGGYGQELGLMGGNTLLGEGATLAAVALMCIPFMLYLMKHHRLLPPWPLVRLGYLALILVAISATIGTYQRTGLIGLAVLMVFGWLRAKQKLLIAVLCVLGAMAAAFVASDGWIARMNTIDDYQTETSANTRLLVWRWTLGFVADHPLGGGFAAFEINEFRGLPTENEPEGVLHRARAFHSVYFEVLGEHGWFGLGLFLAIAVTTLVSLQRLIRATRGVEELLWCHDLAGALQVSLLVLLATGAFIGIAFQPMYWYVFAIAGCLANHVQRAMTPELATHRREVAERGQWAPRGGARAAGGETPAA